VTPDLVSAAGGSLLIVVCYLDYFLGKGAVVWVIDIVRRGGSRVPERCPEGCMVNGSVTMPVAQYSERRELGTPTKNDGQDCGTRKPETLARVKLLICLSI